jgi:hypothetical protein
MGNIQARDLRSLRRPAKLPVTGADVQQLRLGLGLSLAQWAERCWELMRVQRSAGSD